MDATLQGQLVELQYGTGVLPLEVPGKRVVVLRPQFIAGLPDERTAIVEALRQPIGCPALSCLIKASDRVAIVIADITRPLPSDRLLPRLFEELSFIPDHQFVLIVGTGSHRANTEGELRRMVGDEIVDRYEIVNHNAHDSDTLQQVGTYSENTPPLRLNRRYVEADKRIVLGFIEPHFMAGFSGGYKGIFPAIADIASIEHYHRASVIADPRSTWGNLTNNPTAEQIVKQGSRLPLDFCLNVTLNRERQITGVFAGEPRQAHARGSAFAKRTAMVACPELFPIVVTTNGGYPLDQNLYQTVKGMSAAAQIVEDNGLILTAARCNEGFPTHGNFARMLREYPSPQALLSAIMTPGFAVYDQWQAQLFALIAVRAKLGLYSEMPEAEVRGAQIEPVRDLTARLTAELARRGKNCPIAVLPEGPMTIPYRVT